MNRLSIVPKTWRYKMVPENDTDAVLVETRGMRYPAESPPAPSPSPSGTTTAPQKAGWWHRDRYAGALLFNLAAFVLPALYSTLAKLWVARLDAAMVVTTDVYTYVGTVAEVVNEGLPRAAWVIIGDASSRNPAERLQLTHTLVLFQAALGLVLSAALLGGAATFARGFVPVEVRAASLRYVRISAFSVLGGAVETAVAAATRALDKPDVPLLISSAKFIVNIVLDLLLLSRFRVGQGRTTSKPTVNTQAVNQLVCNLLSAVVGLGYFLYAHSWRQYRALRRAERQQHQQQQHVSPTTTTTSLRPNFAALSILLRPGLVTFAESAVRNALYLWLVTTIVALGSTYATAWGIFNTIRWGLVMVPVQALEATSLAFIGHEWGRWRGEIGPAILRPRAARRDLLRITRPALLSLGLALLFEVPLAIFLSRLGARPFAYYLSESGPVADVTAHMWRSIDWCYVFYAMSTMLATILLATRPRWYLYQSLASNVLYVLPWAVACQVTPLDADHAWTYHSLVFGGSLVFSFLDIVIVDGLWAWRLSRGKANLEKFRSVSKAGDVPSCQGDEQA